MIVYYTLLPAIPKYEARKIQRLILYRIKSAGGIPVIYGAWEIYSTVDPLSVAPGILPSGTKVEKLQESEVPEYILRRIEYKKSKLTSPPQ